MRDTGIKNYKQSKKIWITKNGHSSAETKFINENRKQLIKNRLNESKDRYTLTKRFQRLFGAY